MRLIVVLVVLSVAGLLFFKPMTKYLVNSFRDVAQKKDLSVVNITNVNSRGEEVQPKPLQKIERFNVSKAPYQIKEVQSLLKREGFYKGDVDGKVGQGTVRAIKQFQKSRNLQESGVINVKTTQELRKLETGR
ncbi:MAG: peptidoglycan-binding protein [Candidatus Omnitrophica bacterium]|nr:peptidoglycan-binding protein [Candidatus Omnitrophota bacterium]